jgi:hypothetical protein
MKKFVFHIFLLFILFFFSGNAVYGYVLNDNFNDGNFDGWNVVQDPNAPDCIPNWYVDDGILKIDIDNGPCSVNLVPSDDLWGDLGDEYVVEFDAWFIDGSDHNFAFRFTEGLDFNPMHEYHLVGGSGGILGWAPISNVPANYTYTTPNQPDPYHIKLHVETGHFKLYIDGTKVHDYPYPAGNEKRPEGKFAFRAGTGAVNYSENWFDNVMVKTIPEIIDLGHFSQRDARWKDDEYDSASLTNPPGLREIEDWGCALTSGNMLLSRNGYFQWLDGSTLTPRKLNWYLTSEGGYNKNGALIWSYLTKYAQDLQRSGSMESWAPRLEFKYEAFDFDNYVEIITQRDPVILRLVTNDRGTTEEYDDSLHFVVGNGFDGDEVVIDDPWDLLKDHDFLSNKYPAAKISRVGRLVPSNTDLSYIWIYQYNPNIDVQLEQAGSVTGDVAGVVKEEIPNSLYEEAGVLGRPDVFVERFGGENAWQSSVVVAKPDSDSYVLKLSSDEPQEAEYEIHVFDVDGNVKKFVGTALVGNNTEFLLDFNKEIVDNTTFNERVDFEQFIADIEFAYDQRWLRNWGTKRMLISYVRIAQRFYDFRTRNTIKTLETIERRFEIERGRRVTEEGYVFLTERLVLLRQTLGL